MQYDLNIMGAPADTQTKLSLNNTAIYGIQKLVQRVLVLLFTDSSDPINLGLGTSFGKDTTGANADIHQLMNAAAIALSEVYQQLLETTPEDAPDDERIGSLQAVPTNTSEARGTLPIDIIVISAAGASVKIAVPVSKLAQ